MFDVGDSKSFVDIERWMKILESQFEEVEKGKVPIVCVGNKIDRYADGQVSFILIRFLLINFLQENKFNFGEKMVQKKKNGIF